MEWEKENQNAVQKSDTKILYQDELKEYRVYEHPLLPKRIVKRGVCWPALIVGPAYLIYRRLWVAIVIWIVAIGIAQWFSYLFSHDSINANQYTDPDIDTIVELINGGAVLVGLVLLWLFTNLIWENDLKNRGYIMVKSLRARSMDDALAIIEREKQAAHS